MNYKVTKIGLLNFWYFDEEEFNFYDGKLLLRGGNGSGKSVTMQSFIPLILDGNKTPSRLDPFGSKEKKIEDYLLGPADTEQKDDSVGYLYMETYNKEKDKYITIGIGLHARKGRPTDFWGFALKDGKRIGIDFKLYKNYGAKVLMTKKELKANIGPDNILVETNKEYKNMVNNLLFGFKDLDSYDEFINVLLQLRSSKLSKEYTPTKLMDILTSVLKPLTDEDIRPISDAIEDTNKTKEKIETLNNHIKALNNLLKSYQNYNEINLYNKAQKVKEREEIIKNNKKINKENEKNIDNITNRLKEITNKINDLEQELIEITTKLSSIDNKDLKKYTEELTEININLNETEKIIKIIKQKLEKQLEKEKNTIKDLEIIENKITQKDKEKTSLIEEILNENTTLNLEDINLNLKNEEINFIYLENKITKYKEKLNKIKDVLEELEKLEESLSNLEKEEETLKKDIIDKEKINKELINEKEEQIDNFKDNLNLLEKNSKVVKLNENTKKYIFELINNYNFLNYIKAKEEYQKEINYYNRLMINDKNNIQNKITNETKTLKELKEELELLLKEKEIEYEEDDLSKEGEKTLNELNIPNIPLYKVIEFKETIKEEDKNSIEELLISMNILNAKLVPKKYLNNIKNIKSVFLKETSPKKNNILTYFNIIENDKLDKEEIEKILKGISIDNKDNLYINKDKYELDFLIGYPSNKYESKYIGIIKRRENHQRKIKEKQNEITTKEEIIKNYNDKLQEILDKITDIEYMENNFPNNNKLEEININIIKITNTIEELYKRNKDIIININELNNKIKLTIEKINSLKENIQIPTNLLSYKNAINIAIAIEKNLKNLKNITEQKNTYIEQKISKELSLEDTKEEIEYQNEELNEKTKIYNNLITKKKTISEILSNNEYQELITKLKELETRKKEIPKENNSLREEKGKLENELQTLNKQLESDKNLLNKNLIILELQNKILEEEYKLNYVYQDEKLDVYKILNDLKRKENSDISKAFQNYIESFNNYKLELLDYRLSTKEIFNNNEEITKLYMDKGLEKQEINEILINMNRHDLEAIYQGRRLNIFKLNICLEEQIKESDKYIKKQERHLFEDILLKTVGTKIRDRIASSKEWVQKINQIMKTTGANSNLSFELDWKSKTAYTEEELDTKEIVRLLKIDASQLKPEDSDKLVEHFRKQIEKEQILNDKNNDSYADIIFKVLDYRNWFEFKLYYKRKTGEKRELTNKIFSVLSGGERAKSMYVPLFAAVYAKLLNAKENSLRLIALDEAFAGVDNENIREMFDILKELDLDYILTSQVLWGDYDVIKELSICELIKDEIHKAVAVRHYKWNGITKELME